ncbi:MAG: universal stress protein [Halobacteriaceae archaeon]
MGTIFVAYGAPANRQAVLEFAVEQAAAAGHDLLVYHVQESASESVHELRSEVEAVVERTAPGVVYDIEVDTRDRVSDRSEDSTARRVADAVTDGEYEYAVMGDIRRGSIEDMTHASVTETVLDERAVPVVLVPV